MKPALQTLAVLLIVTAVLEAILPQSRSKRAFHVLCAVVLFASLVQPLKGFDFSALELETLFTLPESVGTQMQEQNETARSLAVKTGAETAAKNALESAQIPFTHVMAHCEAQGKEIDLPRLSVTGVPSAQQTRARQILQELFGTGTAINIDTEEEK